MGVPYPAMRSLLLPIILVASVWVSHETEFKIALLVPFTDPQNGNLQAIGDPIAGAFPMAVDDINSSPSLLPGRIQLSK